jgi:hypothetical protein
MHARKLSSTAVSHRIIEKYNTRNISINNSRNQKALVKTKTGDIMATAPSTLEKKRIRF